MAATQQEQLSSSPGLTPGRASADIETAVAQILLASLKRFSTLAKIHLSPNIPRSKAENACKSCLVANEDTVVMIVDNTMLGSAIDCVIFSLMGVYCHNDVLSSSPGRHFLPWDCVVVPEFGTKHGVQKDANIGWNIAVNLNASGVTERDFSRMVYEAVGWYNTYVRTDHSIRFVCTETESDTVLATRGGPTVGGGGICSGNNVRGTTTSVTITPTTTPDSTPHGTFAEIKRQNSNPSHSGGSGFYKV